MICFRPITLDDLDALYQLIQKRPPGLTTLPHNLKSLRARAAHTVESFSNPKKMVEHYYYWFLLEDVSSKDLIGVSALATPYAHPKPFYTYLCKPYQRYCKSLAIKHQGMRLEPSTALQGTSELCTLFLSPSAQQHGVGTFLSRARFLFMAQFKPLFTTQIMAEIRGISNQKGQSPFWEALGKRFFHLPFTKADLLSYTTDKAFIRDLMPQTPIEVSLLSPQAQHVIAKPHPHSQAALHILENEGFQFSNHIDIFDAGPLVTAPYHAIKTIQQCHCLPIQISDLTGKTTEAMVANTKREGFRATKVGVQFNTHHDKIRLSKNVAALLKVEAGEFVRYALY